MKPRSMGRSIGDYVLRRTKDQVLKRPAAEAVSRRPLDLTPEQRESYRMAEEEGVVRLTELGDAATIQHVFELVLRLKQICNFDPATGASAKLERLEADLEEIAAQRPQSDRLQPMGRHDQATGRAARTVRPTGISRPDSARTGATPSSTASATTRLGTCC